MTTQVFAIAPAADRTLWLMFLIPALIAVFAVAFTLGPALGARNARFEVSSDGLRLRGDWYGRAIPLSHLRTAEARRVDLTVQPALEPTRRTGGTGLPGYRAGWFRLRNGERALVFLTDRTRAVYVPTTEGFSLVLSPADPDGFVAALQTLETSARSHQ